MTHSYGYPYLNRPWLEFGREGFQFDDVSGKDEVKRPIKSDPHLAVELWQFEKIDRPPEPPGPETGELDPVEIRHAGSLSERGKLALQVIGEGALLPAHDRSRHVIGDDAALTDGVLRRRRVSLARS